MLNINYIFIIATFYVELNLCVSFWKKKTLNYINITLEWTCINVGIWVILIKKNQCVSYQNEFFFILPADKFIKRITPMHTTKKSLLKFKFKKNI